jgi:hypothetical protein
VAQKPQRTILERVFAYTEEAYGYLRRRRTPQEPFARVHYPGGQSAVYPPDSEAGRRLFQAASSLIDLAR